MRATNAGAEAERYAVAMGSSAVPAKMVLTSTADPAGEVSEGSSGMGVGAASRSAERLAAESSSTVVAASSWGRPGGSVGLGLLGPTRTMMSRVLLSWPASGEAQVKPPLPLRTVIEALM